MMRIIVILIAFSSAAQANEFWTTLWHNADQQGDALMQHGDASHAAKMYSDPRRKAYAKLQAGDYLGAAQDLGKLHDSNSDYNRGNALAHAGDLQGALDAYDAALKSDPKNQDAKHNRELVANAMKQPLPKSRNEKGKPDKPDNKAQQARNSSASNKQDDKGGQDKNTSKPDQADHPSGKTSSQNNAQQKEKSPDTKSQDGKAGQSGREQGKSSQKADSASAQARQPSAKEDAAGRDAAKPDAKNGTGDEISAGRTSNSTRSEQQMAEAQWLRSIPDDPGGLLRRKFLIEHMMRQSEQ